MNKPQTTERLLAEILITFLLFVSIGWTVYRLMKTELEPPPQSTIEDLHQQQEMIDYHRLQGREVSIVGDRGLTLD